jgi:hypothetical protein
VKAHRGRHQLLDSVAAMPLDDAVAPHEADFPAGTEGVLDDTRGGAVGALPEAGQDVVKRFSSHEYRYASQFAYRIGAGDFFQFSTARNADLTESATPITILRAAARK